jgi:hypothetical protein
MTRIAKLLRPTDMTMKLAAVVILGWLLIWGLYGAAEQDRQHNSEQLVECRKLGGFAQTDVNGWLMSCTFPPLTRGNNGH